MVETWIHRFEEAEAKGVHANVAVVDQPHPGREPKITESIGKAILKFTEGKVNRQAPAIKAHVANKFGVTVTVRRIEQWLNEQGLHAYHRSKRFPLTAIQKQKRVRFARKYRNHDWSNTLFTDESQFPLTPSANNPKDDIVWARCHEDVPPAEIDQYSPSVRVWGGVSAKGKTRLMFYTGDLTAKKYVNEILKKAKPDFMTVFGARNRDWTFAHDGASAHKAKSTNEWLENNVPNHITSGPQGDWPAKSADLNATIEHVWGYMFNKLENKRPTTINGLKRRLTKLWEDLDHDGIERQAGHMQKRLKSVISSGGEWTED